MQFSSLRQWLFWLEAQRFDRCASEAFCAVKEVTHRLQLLPVNVPVITMTGTNGKGSCVALCESIYLAAGYKVATFTSPHLLRFNERIRLKGKKVDDREICEAFQKIEEARKEISLTYFQFALLAALIIFQKQSLDVILLEVGIGGRFDPTNVVDADLSVITNIALDHCQLLGNTRNKVAFEKAGILRVGKPCVCGDMDPPPALIQRVRDLKVPFYCYQKDFDADVFDLAHLSKPNLLLSNIAVALMAIKTFHLPVSKKAIVCGMAALKLPGRRQLIRYQNKNILLDVAHNPAAIALLSRKIQSLRITGRVFAICGMCEDKELDRNLETLTDQIDAWHLVTMNHPRGASAKQLKTILEKLNVKNISLGFSFTSALENVFQQASVNDLVVIFGSFMLVGQWVKCFQKEKEGKALCFGESAVVVESG